MRTTRLVVSLLCCVLLGGCYMRQPLDTPAPAPSTRIVAAVTDSGAVAMGNSLGPGAMAVEGVVSTATDTEWTLLMLRVDHRDGRSIPWNRETVSFPRDALSDPFVVVLDKRRSWLAAGATIAGALLVARGFTLLFGGDAGDPNGEPPPPQADIVPGVGR